MYNSTFNTKLTTSYEDQIKKIKELKIKNQFGFIFKGKEYCLQEISIKGKGACVGCALDYDSLRIGITKKEAEAICMVMASDLCDVIYAERIEKLGRLEAVKQFVYRENG